MKVSGLDHKLKVGTVVCDYVCDRTLQMFVHGTVYKACTVYCIPHTDNIELVKFNKWVKS